MNSPVLTDDRGVFRVFGLAAGAYLVAARPTRMPAETQVESDQAVDKALAELRSRTSPAQMRPTPTSAPSEVAGTVVTWAPVWFPGVVSADLAAQVVVQAGEERSGVDIRVGPVGASSLRGVVTEASGRAIVPQVRIWPVGTLLTGTTPRLVEAPSTSNGDRFQFDNLVPGRYTVLAQARVSGPGLPADPTESSDLEWAITEITAGGGNIEGLELALRASLTVQGRITVEAPHAAEPLDLTGLRVELVRRSGANSAIGPPNPPPATVKAGGTFELRDLLPGSYSLSCAIPPRLTGVLWLRSATSSSADHDLLDEGLSLTADAPAPVTLALTLSDRRSALSGTFFASSGTGPPEDTAIVVFPANSGWWDPFSRRVRMARPATDGHYEFRDLPPGDYYVTAISDPDPDTWSDPATLAQLIASSVRVSIASGEQKTLDLRPAKALH
jgi:hypothetical protein